MSLPTFLRKGANFDGNPSHLIVSSCRDRPIPRKTQAKPRKITREQVQPRRNDRQANDQDIARATKASQRTSRYMAQRPFSLVQDSGFVDYIKYITLKLSGLELEVPSRNAIAGEICLRAVQLRVTLKERIQSSCKYYCLTTDVWTDRAMRSFMAVTLHYLDDKFNMYDWTLEVEELPGKHTGSVIALALEKVLARWGLDQSYCVRLVRDGASNAVSAGNHIGILHASCLAHSLHLVVGGAMTKKKAAKAPAAAVVALLDVAVDKHFDSTASDDEYEANVASVIFQLQDGACAAIEEHFETRRLDEQQALSKMREIVQVFRSIAVYLRKSAKAKGRFLKIRRDVQPGCNKWLQVDCPTRWSSCHAMLTRFVDLKATVENFFAYMNTPPGIQEFGRVQQTRPSQEHWLAIECLVLLLDPFAAVSVHLGGSHYPTLVAAVPALRHIKADLSDEHLFDQKTSLARSKMDVTAVVSHVHQVRLALLRAFRERFDVQDSQLQWISYLDPRLTEMGNLEPNEAVSAHQRLINHAVDVAKMSEPSPEVRDEPLADPQLVSPEKNMSRLLSSLYGRRSRATPASSVGAQATDDQLRKRCESEFVMYLKDAAFVTIQHNPLDWWRANASKYPVLAELARQWLCCVATSVPSERAFSRGGNVVEA